MRRHLRDVLIMLKLEIQFKIKIVYKSGHVHEFWVRSFTVTSTGYKWDSVEHNNKPLEIGGPEIAAVWQVGHRYRIATKPTNVKS